MSVLTNYVISENLRSKSQNDASIGRQLIYTPMYSGMAKFGVDYKNLQFHYRHNYTGIRYTSTDNFQYLEPFDLGAIQASYVVKLSEYPIRFFFEINNLWNENYQIISQRPMPGRNFHAGISIQFKNILTINNSI